MGKFRKRGSSWAEGAGHGRAVAVCLLMGRLECEFPFCSVCVLM